MQYLTMKTLGLKDRSKLDIKIKNLQNRNFEDFFIVCK